MNKALLKYIKEQKILQQEDKLVVAVSGGADSVALCYLLKEINISFLIAHCNFQLRGNESEEDEIFVQELGKKLGVEVFTKRFDLRKAAYEEIGSIQMLARSQRYKWFESLREKENCTLIATAHHKSDNLETLLLNIARGTGIAGLHGIQPRSNKIVRPLLFATKEEIYEYLKNNKISFREDSSNSIEKYDRNLVRLKVIPELKKLNPDIENTIQTFFEKISSVEEIFIEQVEKFKSEKIITAQEQLIIPIDNLKKETGALIKLYELLKEFNFTFSQTKDLLNLLNGQPGKKIESYTHFALKDRKEIVIQTKNQISPEKFTISPEMEVLETKNFSLDFDCVKPKKSFIPSSKNVACLDLNKLKFPLELRKWKKGDFFFPIGMKGKKKISDFLVDSKVSLLEKEKIYVLTSGGEIAWVVGRRLDERFKVTEDTEDVFLIAMKVL